jgi:hypothetical protein
MPKITIVYTEEWGEAEAAFDEKGEMIHYWSCNDATWRGEYFEPLFEHFGIEFGDDTDNKLTEKFEAYLKKEYSDDEAVEDES